MHKDSESESDSLSSQDTGLSSKIEKLSTKLDRKRMSMKNPSDNSSEGIPQARSMDSDQYSTRSHKSKKSKNLDVFSHYSNQVAPAADYEDAVLPSEMKHIEKRRRQSKSKSFGDALKNMYDSVPKRSRNKSLAIFFKSKSKAEKSEKSQKRSSSRQRERAKSIIEPTEPMPGKYTRSKSLGMALMVPRDVNTNVGARPVAARRKTLEQTAEAMQSTSSATGTTFPKDSTDSVHANLKHHRKSLASPNVSHNHQNVYTLWEYCYGTVINY